MEGAMFSLYSPIPHLWSTWSWGQSCQTGGLITSGKKRFVYIKELIKSTAAINGAFQFHPFTVFIITGVHWTSVLKLHFAKQFWITAGMMDFHATETPCMTYKMFNFLMSSAGSFLFLATKNVLHTFSTPMAYSLWCPAPLVPCNW